MIAKLTGLVDGQGDGAAVIDVNGVGYLVFCSGRTLARLPGRGEATRLLVETHVREDHIHLYGFADEGERTWFRLLTTVQGVGAKVALSILTVLSPDRLLEAIAAQDRTALTQADGVGPKLATRILSELRGKTGGLVLGAGLDVAAAGRPQGAAADAVSALVNLGYGRAEAAAAIADAAGGSAAPGVDTLIRAGLKRLATPAR